MHVISTRDQGDHHMLLVESVNILHQQSVDVNNSVKSFKVHKMCIEISGFSKARPAACSIKRPLLFVGPQYSVHVGIYSC